MSEPAWKTELRALAEDLDRYGDAEHTMARLLPHVEAAYKRGLMAGRSQSGYDTRRKAREGDSWSARSASDIAASADEPPEGSAP